jgi:hypothetical protein
MFRMLDDQLDDEWDVYYSVALLTKENGGRARDGEIDFVAVHPELGIVCIETKGTVQHRNGRWQERYAGEWKDCRDPGEQVTGHLKSLQRAIAKELGWKSSEIRISRLVALTGSVVPEVSAAPDLPRDVIVDQSDLFELEDALERSTAFELGERDKTKPLGEDGRGLLRTFLAPSNDFSPQLSDQFDLEEIRFKQLTADQKRVLSGVASSPRAAIIGCAGSGKTVIAREMAVAAAESGKSVLMVCFNSALADHLNARNRHDQITISHFHGLCRSLAKEAKLRLPKPPPKNDHEATALYFNERLPELLLEALSILDVRYDVLIVDEAQDLLQDWYEILETTLRDEASSQIWLFLDDNQQVYSRAFTIPAGYGIYHLTRNCRNTVAIHEQVKDAYTGTIEIESQGPPGRPVEFMADTANQPAAVAGVIERLVDEEGVSPHDIVVLSPHRVGSPSSEVANQPGRFCFVHGEPKRNDEVRFSSIKAFKGLEAPVVIVCELDHLSHEQAQNEIYVAYSRAKNHLVVVGAREKMEV